MAGARRDDRDVSSAETVSGIEVPDFAAPDDRSPRSDPGTYPFVRGIELALYRDKTWVMGMYSGFSSAKETNRRIRRLIEKGQRGFSVALDLPTQNGVDSDHALARGEVGRVGVPIDTLADVEDLLDGIPFEQVDQIRTTANAIGPLAVAFFAVAAEKARIDPTSFRLLLQNDVLKEYVARGTYIFPPEPGLKFSVDVIEYCANELPNWEPIEFCGYHIRDSGSTAVQELGVAIANAIAYLDEAESRGVSIDAIAPHVFMFLSSGLDLFEEVAKFRAARLLWSKLLTERYGVSEERCGLRIFCYTLGSLLTAAEPLNNSVRVAYEALAAALGGVQTLATSSYDEALGLPSDEAVHLSLRTQQILAHETGVRRATDPLGGSYYVEQLTDELARRTDEYVERIRSEGGALAVLESGWLSADIGKSAYEIARAVDSGARPVVGVNLHAEDVDADVTIRPAQIRAEAEAEQIARLHRVRAERDQAAVDEACKRLREAAVEGRNTVPFVIDAVRVYASVGDICSSLQSVWGKPRSAAWKIS
ncbi:MAG: methylmalonyl-CoA mutase [Ilumatobacter sp.]|uniref:acyl-CoA mutase large subunit family protein n=1 Tax=Ilumatobacter sp. TaxID=1967498 RepID=UPI00391B7EF2